MSEKQSKLLYAKYSDKQSLYNCYIGFMKDGGLFIPGTQVKSQMSMGQNINFIVEIPNDANLYFVSGKISWINLNKRKGYGVRLNNDETGRSLKVAIENTLGAMIAGANPTYTM